MAGKTGMNSMDGTNMDNTERNSADVQEKARQAVERLAHTQMDLSLSDWSDLSSAILAAINQPTQADEIERLRAALQQSRSAVVGECAAIADSKSYDSILSTGATRARDIAKAIRALAD